ncbi:MAG: hypothetical protein VYC34_08700, partial [Planctomycetota bacterium]|nr:hypothetical protein [Planctomycetota bacterium]
MSTLTRPARAAAIAAMLSYALAALGCDYEARFKETRVLSVPHVPAQGVDVETANGRVTIERVEREDVSITAHIAARTQERLDLTTVIAERDPDGVLAIRVEWPEGRRLNSEKAAFEIEVPDAY